MTGELWMAAAAIGLAWVQVMIAATPNLIRDLQWAFGNRETPLERSPWAARAERAAENMKENLPLFLGLVLLVHVSGSADARSALGATVFVAARAAHGALYLAGVPYLRTAAWAVSVAGMFLVASALA